MKFDYFPQGRRRGLKSTIKQDAGNFFGDLEF